MELRKFERAVVKKSHPDQGVQAGDVVVLLDRVETNGRVGWLVEGVTQDYPYIVAAIGEEHLNAYDGPAKPRKADETPTEDRDETHGEAG